MDRDSARSLSRLREDLHLPAAAFSPYTQYSLLVRCQALRGALVEHCSWEQATPALKDPNRTPDPSTYVAGPSISTAPNGSFLSPANTRACHSLAAPGDPAITKLSLCVR